MKKGIISLTTVFVFILSATSGWAANNMGLVSSLFLPLGDVLNVVDWQVGEFANFSLDLGILGQGTVTKKVTGEENTPEYGEAVWVETDVKMPMGAQNVRTLIDRDTGKILKLIVDGKEQEVEEPNLEVFEQRAEKVTVPAGTFRSIYIRARDHNQDADIEAWINPTDIPVGGILKSVIKKGFITMTMELTEFGSPRTLEATYNFSHSLMNLPI